MQVAPPSPIRCAVLTSFGWDFPTLYGLSTPGVEFFTFDQGVLGLPESPNPFRLETTDSADVALVSSYWYGWLMTKYGDSVDATFQRLGQVAKSVVGFDAADQFSLEFPPEAFHRFRLVLKANGVYRDRDLYNYRVGCLAPGGNWTTKSEPLSQRYSDSALGKLRLGLPCFVRDVPSLRRHVRARGFRLKGESFSKLPRAEYVVRSLVDGATRAALTHMPIRGRPLEVSCLGSLTHVQRLDALRGVAGFSGVRGISYVPEHIRGTNLDWDLPATERETIVEAARQFRRKPVSRLRFGLDLSRHKVVLAPTGYGEVSFRHGEALRAGAALVCQSLDHVDLRFPFRDDQNVVFCRPDLSDLTERVRELLADERRRTRIAAAGRRDILNWDSSWRDMFDAAIAAPLRESLGQIPSH